MPIPKNKAIPICSAIAALLWGFIDLMIEIAGARALAPFFGSGAWTWSAQIGVALLSLAAGYAYGGKKSVSEKPGRVLFFASCCQAVLCALSPRINPLLSEISFILAGELAGTFMASIFAFAPSLFLGGLSAMACVAMFRKCYPGELEAPVGTVWALSTIGSFFGAIVTGFWSMLYLGVPGTFLLASALSIVCAAMALPSFEYRPPLFPMFIVILVFCPSLYFTIKPPTPIDVQSSYGSFKVVDAVESKIGSLRISKVDAKMASHLGIKSGLGAKIMSIDGLIQSVQDDYGFSSLTYISALSSVPVIMRPESKTSCWIGIGGGTGPLVHRNNGLSVSAVDLDPEIVRLAHKHFSLPNDMDFSIGDGRRWLSSKKTASCDIIALDAFSGEVTPAHLATKEFFQEVKRVMNAKGVLAVNFISMSSVSEKHDLDLFARTSSTVFKHVSLMRVPHETDFPSEISNWLMLASDEKLLIPTAFPPLKSSFSKNSKAETIFFDPFSHLDEMPFPKTGDIATDAFNPIERFGREARRVLRSGNAVLGIFISHSENQI